MTAMRNVLLPTALAAVAGCSALVGDDELAPAMDAPPAIAITSPVAGAAVSSIVTVSGTVSSTSAASVRFDLPDGTSLDDAAPPFSVAWDSTTVPDARYAIHATATDAAGAVATTSVTFLVANGPCLGTFVAQGLPRRIPDASPGGVASSLAITQSAGVASLALSLRITHPFPPDLRIALIAPGGARIRLDALAMDPGASGIAVDDLAISAFDGQSAGGLWTLAVQDVEYGDVGTLDAWSLSVAGSCSPASHPSISARSRSP